MKIRIRDADPHRDLAFIMNCWMRTMRYGREFEMIPNDVFHTKYHRAVTDLLAKCSVRVAVDIEDPDMIYGFVVAQRTRGAVLLVHFAYTKDLYRGRGVASALLSKIIDDASPKEGYITGLGSMVWVGHYMENKFGYKYDPFLVNKYNNIPMESNDGIRSSNKRRNTMVKASTNQTYHSGTKLGPAK